MFVGADGCKKQWLTIKLIDNDSWEIGLFQDIYSLWDVYRDLKMILVDVPIGLREKDDGERLCDKEARRLLGPERGRSVFPAPCRNAAYAEASKHKEASSINKQCTGRGLSIQAWSIIPYILQVDRLLSENENARSCIREVHPEICFWALAGGRAMRFRKKTSEGYSERVEVLKSVYPNAMCVVNNALDKYSRKDVGRDDIVDALVAAVTAMVGEGRLQSIPVKAELDNKGFAMEMVYCPL